ncbi:MAG: flavodoxin family protein [Pseudomonadota bacterium]
MAIHGSPREGGNSDLLLTEAIKGVEEAGSSVQLIKPAKMSIAPCKNCGGCTATGKCVQDDDMSDVYDVIRSSDRVILSSPIFFLGLPAQLKAMIDRCQAFWCEKYLMKRPIKPRRVGRRGLLFLVGGMRMKSGYECAGTTATAFFRTINVYEYEISKYAKVDEKGAIKSHPNALKDAREAGKRLVTALG